MKIPGVNQNRSCISRCNQEKIIWNFSVSCFLALKFIRGVTQFCGISKGEALFCLELPRVSDKSIKIPGFFSKVFVHNSICLDFSRIAILSAWVKHQILNINFQNFSMVSKGIRNKWRKSV